MQPQTVQTGNYVQAIAGEKTFSLGLGQPSPRLLPLEIVGKHAAKLQNAQDPLLLQYNRGDGALDLRCTLANLLSARRSHPVKPDTLLTSNGNSQALDWLARGISSPGDHIISEDPSYFLASKIFRDTRLQIHSVPMDENGLNVAALFSSLRSGLRPKWLYCIPAHHNPTGVNLSRERLYELVDLAHRYNFLLVFDDPYAWLSFDEEKACALDELTMDDDAHWIRLGTFSKIFAPGLRLGWIEAPPRVREKLLNLGMLRSGGGLNPIAGALMRETIESGALEEHRRLVVKTLAERAHALTEAVQMHLPDATLWPVSGGYFGWIEWKAGFDARRFARYCKERGVHFLAGELASNHPNKTWTHCGRVSVSFYEKDELRAAIELMGQCYRSFLTQSA